MRLTTLFLIVFAAQAHAGLKPGHAKAISKPFFLEGTEVKKLKSELIKMKFADDSFVLKFICDKQKRTPKARNRSINCLAVSVSPEPVTGEVKASKAKRRRSARRK